MVAQVGGGVQVGGCDITSWGCRWVGVIAQVGGGVQVGGCGSTSWGCGWVGVTAQVGDAGGWV